MENNVVDIYPLSPMQEGMLFHALLAPEDGAHFEQLSCTLDGELDTAAFEQAWQRVIDRHGVLRTGFLWERRDKPFQVVFQQLPFPWVRQSWDGLSPTELSALRERFLRDDRRRLFDLSSRPLMRLALVELAPRSHLFVWSFHHLLLDGWSVPLVLREVFAWYEALRLGREPHLEPPRPYRSYISWLGRQDRSKAEAFWRRTLAGFRAPTPVSASSPWKSTGREGDRERESLAALPQSATAALNATVRKHEITLNTAVQSAWALLLCRSSSESDVVFGTTVSGRPTDLPGADSMVGLFINTLPVRAEISGGEPLPSLWRRLHARLVEAGQYDYAPLVDIHGWSEVPRGLPLFESLVVFENYPVDASLRQRSGSLAVGDVRFSERANVPLILLAEPREELRLRILYDGDRFDAPAISRLLSHLINLLTGFAACLEEPGLVTAAIPMLTAAERQQILAEWNDSRGAAGPEACLHELFDLRCQADPKAVAVVGGGRAWTYGEVSRWANRMAYLLRRLEVGPGVLVGVQLERCPEMVPVLLAILKAGGAYVPLETSWPQARIEEILASTGLRYLVTQSAQLLRFAGQGALPALAHVIAIDRADEGSSGSGWRLWQPETLEALPSTDPPGRGGADDLAYVIFTSGSTGTPKGVMVRHRPVINLIEWVNSRFSVGSSDRVLCVASLCFDLSVYDIFGLLAAGGSIRVASAAELAAPESLVRILCEEPITFWDSAPAALQQLAPLLPAPQEAAPPRSLRLVFLSGDWIPLSLPGEVRASFPQAEVISLGGATEATVWSNVFPVGQIAPSWVSIPYGRPIRNAEYHVLDSDGQVCPIGVAGDLYIGGSCLSSGYLGEPALTAAKYVPDPFSPAPGAVLYKTGDQARYWPDGNLEFLGRLDHQVKIRGFRIELGEIESCLGRHSEVADTVLLAREDEPGQRRLVAYVIPAAGAEPDAVVLRSFLQDRLPPYMVPSAFVFLDRFPVTANGKLDRRALPAPGGSAEAEPTPTAPGNPLEELIARVWAEVLGHERVDPEDNFFELGGHSVLATQIVSRLRRIFQVDLSLRGLFEAPTPAALARRVGELLRGGTAPPVLELAPRPAEPPLSFAQERLWMLEQLSPGNAAYHIPAFVRIAGPLDVPAFSASLGEIRRRHEILRTRFVLCGELPVQVIDPPAGFCLPLVDLAGCPEDLREAELGRLAAAESRRSFDLENGPLFRAALLRLTGTEHALLATMHHAVSDGPSIEILIRELGSLYTAVQAGQGSPLSQPALQYADFAVWQRRRLPEIEAAELAVWSRRLTGAPPLLELPLDRPRPAVESFRGTSLRVPLPADLSAGVAALAARAGVTRFMAWLALFQALLARVSRQDDLLVGFPFANRDRSEMAGLIGLFVNTLVVRTHAPRTMAVRALLGQVREAALAAYAHSDLPFERLLEALQPPRSLSHHPLFQVLFTLERDPGDLLREVPGLELRVLPSVAPAARLDLSLTLTEGTKGLAATLEYRTGLFDEATAVRLLGHLATLASAVAEDPDRPLGRLPLLSSEERRQLAVWSSVPAAVSARGLASRIFAARAAAAPDAPAVICGEERLSYRELDRQVNRLARRLRGLGVGPETRVGVCLDRSPASVASLLAVFRAGGAYVPLDPAYPAERLAFLVEDAGITWFVTESRHAGRLPLWAGAALLLDTDAAAIGAEDAAEVAETADAETLAYIIYTSGSTGRPKGVAIEHGSLSAVLAGALETLGFAAGDSIPAIAPFSFDISLFEVIGPLLAGGTCHLLPERPLDLPRLLAMLEETTFFHAVPALMRQVVDTAREDTARAARFGGLRTLLVGGDRVPPDLVEDLRSTFPAAQVRILYGPTESTILCASCHVPAVGPVDRALIGRPLPGAVLHLWDEDLEPVPQGVAGEICVGGAGVARGYWNREELTRERFVMKDGERVYRTGDLARRLPDGTLEFLGRTDQQVKIRGFRIDPGEVEAVLREHPGVLEAVVVALEEGSGDRRLVAYVVPAGEGPSLAPALRAHLAERLPEFMVPSLFVRLDAIPLTPHGKVDRRALPIPDGGRPEEEASFTAPATPLESALATIFADVLGLSRVGAHDDFFQLGGHSLLATRVLARIRKQLRVELPLHLLFELRTVARLAGALAVGEGENLPAPPPLEPAIQTGLPPQSFAQERLRFLQPRSTAVAVVGLAGRFPGARTVAGLWRNLRDGVESVSFFTAEEIAAAGVDPRLLDDPRYVRAKGALADADLFDAAFFGVTPREAEWMDPQHRVFLECAWEALEDAGCDPGRFPGRVGVYAGAGANAYLIYNLLPHGELAGTMGALQLLLLNERDFLASRASFKLGLTGPSLAVQTACSTSLVTIHLACQALFAGECDLALAGGVSISVPLAGGYLYQEGSVLSPDGRCRAFDADAAGAVEGNGCGVVALKRLTDALAEGDRIYAVVRGSAVTNDGAARVGFTAPGVEGQASAVSDALLLAGVDPETIGYVETHGSGTPLGDSVEIAALTQAFRRAGARGTGFCAVGSVKTKLGHCNAAAGVAGFLEAVLSLHHRTLPPSLHFTRPNPRIDFAMSPFYVCTSAVPWEVGDEPRRAGVSAFGLGGTNAHVVLEEAPAPAPAWPAGRTRQLLVLSARTPEALDAATVRLAEYFETEPRPDLADLAWTLQTGRHGFEHRRTAVARDGADAVAALRDPARRTTARCDAAGRRPVAFLFPGLGDHGPDMAREVYETEPLFREQVDLCARTLAPWLGCDLREALFPGEWNPAGRPARGDSLRAMLRRDGGSEDPAAAHLTQTVLAQPACFVVEYALARLLMSWGVEPRALLGYSLGEYVAVCLAGSLDLQDALALVARRAQLIQALPLGAMLAVPWAEEEVRPLLGGAGDLSISATNGPHFCVVAGPEEAVGGLERRLAERGAASLRLRTTHAFHSAMMEPAMAELTVLARGIETRPPRIPCLSNVTGTWITEADLADPGYWARHMRGTVRFAEGLTELLREPGRVCVEIGPGSTLSTLVRQHPKATAGHLATPTLGRAGEVESGAAELLAAVGHLWTAGVELDWEGFHGGRRRIVTLPTYPFERQRYWVDPPRHRHPAAGAVSVPVQEASPASAPLAPGTRAPRPALSVAYVAPRSEAETSLVAIWQELFGIEPIGVEDSFLELGGQSLLAIQMTTQIRGAFDVELPVTALFETPTVAGLAATVAQARGEQTPEEPPPVLPVSGPGGVGDWPLSFDQERLLRLHLDQPDMVSWNVDAGVRMVGPLDVPALLAAFDGVVRRHAAWRTTFPAVDGRRVQRVVPWQAPEAAVIDLTALPAAAREPAAHQALLDRARTLFDLERGPLVRVTLVRLGEREHLCRIAVHHLVIDWITAQTCWRELVALYAAHRAGRPAGLPPPPVQYPDYVLWERDWMRDEVLAEHSELWRRRLAGFPLVLELPADRPRPPVQSQRGGFFRVQAGADRTDRLRALARREGMTMFMATLAVLDALLYRFSGLDRIVVGSNSANRARPELEAVFGFFLTQVPFPVDLSGNPTFRELLARVKRSALESYTHQNFPFSRLVEALGVEPDPSRNPVIQVLLLVLEGQSRIDAGDVELHAVPLFDGSARWDLTFGLYDDRDVGLAGSLEYNADIFEAATVGRLLELFGRLIDAVLANPDIRLSRLPGVDEPAERQILAPPDGSGDWPLSFAQERLWFLHQMDPGSPVYNVFSLFRLEGDLPAGALERALAAVVRRHEALRTRFRKVAGEPVQVVEPPRPWLLSVIDLAALPAAAREAELRGVASAAALQPFDLAAGPLLRTLLLESGASGRAFLFATHHIVSDAWSMGVLVRDLAAVLRGEERRLPSLSVRYADYALWQRSWLTGPALEAQLTYWRRQLAGASAFLALPIDRPRPVVQTFRGAKEPVALSPRRTAALHEFARREGATPFLVLLAIFQTLLFRLTGQVDFCLGSPVSGRGSAETEHLVGLFVNTLVLRADLGGQPTFREVLARAREVALTAQTHQDVPLEKLIADLQPQRDLSHTPLFQVLCGLHTGPRSIELPGARLAPLPLPSTTAMLDLSLLLSDVDGTVEGGLEYNTDLFEAVTLRRIAGYWRSLLEAALSSPERQAADLPLLSPAEAHQLLVEWSATAPAPGGDGLLHELFAAQARRTPDAVALVDGARRITYRKLEERSDRLARRLRGLGVGPEMRVGICSRRTAEMVTAFLAVLSAGGAYVPLDPAYPAERLSFTLADSRVAVLLIQTELRGLLPGTAAEVLLLDEEAFAPDAPAVEPPAVLPGNLAYLIYTSGSTGRPKGVAVEHETAVRMVEWAAETYREVLGGVFFCTSVNFDPSVMEIFAPLSIGGTVIVAEDALALTTLPERDLVTFVDTVPSALSALLEAGPLPPSVRVVGLAGEPLRRSLADRFYAQGADRELWNLYGPTEDTIYSTAAVVPAGETREPLIGRPIAGSQGYVADRRRIELLPAGVPGELFIGGGGIVRGYWRRPDLTAERFVPDPFSGTPGGRLYCTGDKVRWRPDGQIEFLGRFDHQVKIRGFRIEMGEIEVALARHLAVREALVVAAGQEPGGLRLIAYVVGAAGAPSRGELRGFLEEILPNHMIPADFVFLEAIPRTPNGKVDRQALPAPDRARPAADGPLRTPLQEIVADAWTEVLGVSAVSGDEDFFELGGHSLLATRVASRLQERLGIELSLRSLFQHPTVAAFAMEVERKLATGKGEVLPPVERTPRDGAPLPLSFAQERLWFFDRLEPGSPIYNVSGVLLLQGPFNAAALAAGLSASVRRHESLRTCFVEQGQLILPPRPVELPRIDLRALPAAVREVESRHRAAAEARRPFDLRQGPLLRAVLIELEEERRLVAVTLHHIACDGWSLNVLIREVLELYTSFAAGRPMELPELPVQYADFAHWQRTWLQGEALEAQLAYWTRHLGGAPPLLALPYDRPRPLRPSYRGGAHRLTISPEVTADLRTLGRGEGATLFMTLLAAWALLLERYSGQSDIVIGSNIANRHRRDLEGLIGLLANTVALRIDLSGDPTVRELLARARETVLGAHAHQDLPFEKLVETLRPERDAAYHPVFQVMLILQEPAARLSTPAGLDLVPVGIEHGLSKFDLTLFAVEEEGGIMAELEYDADLFAAETIADLAGQLVALLETLPAWADEPVSALPAVSIGHQESLLGAFTEDLEI